MFRDAVAPAPEWETVQWFNSRPLTLAELRGRVVVVEAFQMLCPGCVSHGLPQAQRVARLFHPDDVVVVGLHTVFEHHDAMPPAALEVFLSEYRIGFPVGVDRHVADDPTPVTMARYGLRGTPSTLVIDRAGLLRFHAFGAVDDLALGATIGRLLGEATDQPSSAAPPANDDVCNPDGCLAP